MTLESINRIKILTIMAPIAYFGGLEVLRERLLETYLTHPQVTAIVIVVTTVAALLFTEFVFSLITRMEHLLDRERQRITAIFRHTSDAVLLVDEEGRVTAMNPAAYLLTGLSPDDVREGRVAAADVLPGDGVRPLWREAGERGALPYFESVVRTAGKEEVPVAGSAAAIPAPEGGSQVAFILKDFSEKKALEAEVRRRQLQAEGLYRIGLTLSSLSRFDDNLGLVLDEVRQILGAGSAACLLFDESTGEWSWRPTGRELSASPRQVEKLARQAMAAKEPVVSRARGERLLLVPILLRGRPVGVLAVGAPEQGEFSTADALFLSSAATQVAVALENRELYARGQSQAVLEERERVAKEMHDGFGQTLTYLTAMVATVEHLLRRSRVDEALRTLADARSMLKEAHEEVRMAIFNLRQRPDDSDFVKEVRQLAEQFSRQSGIEAEFVCECPQPLTLPFEKSIQVLRVIQEALNNVRKHSGARHATVRIARREDTVEVSVRDDGRGFDPASVEQSDRFGLRIMQERSRDIGGELHLETAPGAGTTVRLVVPLRRWAAARAG